MTLLPTSDFLSITGELYSANMAGLSPRFPIPPPQGRLPLRAANLPVKAQRVNILGFLGQIVPIATIQPCCCTKQSQTIDCGSVSIKLYLQRQTEDQIWLMDCSLLTLSTYVWWVWRDKLDMQNPILPLPSVRSELPSGNASSRGLGSVRSLSDSGV